MNLNLALMYLAGASLLTGCGRDAGSPARARSKPTIGQETMDQMKESASATRQSAAQAREDVLAAAERQLKELDAEIDELGRKVEGLNNGSKVEANRALAELRDQRILLARKFEELKHASDDTWDKTRAGFAAAWNETKKTYDNAKSRVY